MYFIKFYIFPVLLINFISLNLLATEERGFLKSDECKTRILRRDYLPSDFLPSDKERVKKADEIVIKYFKALSERHMSHILHSEILNESYLCKYNNNNKCLNRFFRYSRSHVWSIINYVKNSGMMESLPSLKESTESLENNIKIYAENKISYEEKQKCYAAIGRGYFLLSNLPTDSIEQKNEYMKKSWENLSNIKKITSKTVYLWKAQLLQNGLILGNEDLSFKEWDNQKNNQENTKIIYDNLLNLLNSKKDKKERKNEYTHTHSHPKKEKNPLIPLSDQLTQRNMKEELYQLNLAFFTPVQNNTNQQNDDDNIDGESLNSEELEMVIREENNQNRNNNHNLHRPLFWSNPEEDEQFNQLLNLNQQNANNDDENIFSENFTSEEQGRVIPEENNNNFWYDSEDDQPFVQQSIQSFDNLNNREKRKAKVTSETKCIKACGNNFATS